MEMLRYLEGYSGAMGDSVDMPDVDTIDGNRTGLDWAYDAVRAGHFQIFHVQKRARCYNA